MFEYGVKKVSKADNDLLLFNVKGMVLMKASGGLSNALKRTWKFDHRRRKKFSPS